MSTRCVAVNDRVHHLGEPQLLGVVLDVDFMTLDALVKFDDAAVMWCDLDRLEWVHGPLLPRGMVQRGW